METPDQKSYWNQHHQERKMSEYSHQPTSLAQYVARLLPPQSHLLELGCGEGNDSSYFANKGHNVRAVDFAESIINNNQQRYSAQPNLSFEVADISQQLPFTDQTFDGVYARLTLHYFTDETTQQAFKDIGRVLKR